MAASSTTIWKIALGVLVAYLLLARRGPRRNVAAPQAPAAPPAEPAPAPAATERPPPVPKVAHGLRIVDGELQIANWHDWMRFATRMARRAVAEGAYTPDQVIARIFYAAFPEHDWPPDADSPLCETYDLLVGVAQTNLDAQLRPLRVRSGGLKLVD